MLIFLMDIALTYFILAARRGSGATAKPPIIMASSSLGAPPLTLPLFCDDRKGGKNVFFSLSQIKETKEMLFRHAFRNPL